MAKESFDTPAQYIAYRERKDREYQDRQRMEYEQNRLRMELDHLDKLEEIVDEYEARRTQRETRPLYARMSEYDRRKKELYERIDRILSGKY